MNNSTIRNISVSESKILSLKKCFPVGRHIVVILDDSIVQRLGITEGSYVEEEITQNGILLKPKIGGICE